MNERRGLTAGVVLIFIGLYLSLRNVVSWRGPAPILLLLGAALVITSALRRFRGPLLGGAILLGLGAAFLLRDSLEPWLPHWATLLLGIAAGFLAVAALDASVGRRRQPAPAIVGLLLLAIAAAAGVSRSIGALAFDFNEVARFWPWLLVAAGIALIVQSAKRRTTS